MENIYTVINLVDDKGGTREDYFNYLFEEHGEGTSIRTLLLYSWLDYDYYVNLNVRLKFAFKQTFLRKGEFKGYRGMVLDKELDKLSDYELSKYIEETGVKTLVSTSKSKKVAMRFANLSEQGVEKESFGVLCRAYSKLGYYRDADCSLWEEEEFVVDRPKICILKRYYEPITNTNPDIFD